MVYDDRSRLVAKRDSVGHSVTREYDGLDRVTTEALGNTKGGSPAVVKTYAYWPGGQQRAETNGLGLARTTTLNGMARPSRVVEMGPGLPEGGLVTTYGYDEAGNRTEVVDRRGVKTQTAYDWGDRPVQVSVSVGDTATFAGQGGDGVTVGQNGVVGTYGYDAVGNKVFETDRYGYRTDYQLDPLYRVVRVESPSVPGASIGAGAVRYTTSRRFDLVGNKTREVDGNGNATAWTYDVAGRLVRTVDGAGRVERRSYDRNGNVIELRQEAPEGRVQLRRTSTYDGVNRPRVVTEEVASLSGTITYRQETVYDDANRVVASSDRRGYVTTTRLDDLDRVYETVVDDGSGLLERPSGASSALALTTRYQYDAAGNRAVTVDPLGRRTEEVRDGLGRVTRRNLPMGVFETVAYDGEGQAVSTTDLRGVERRTRRDVLGRPTVEQLVENVSAGGTALALVTRTYSDVASSEDLVSVTERDARGHSTVAWLDGLRRTVRTVDAAGNAIRMAYDGVNRRGEQDRKGHLTTYQYDGANRQTVQEEYSGASVAYGQVPIRV